MLSFSNFLKTFYIILFGRYLSFVCLELYYPNLDCHILHRESYSIYLQNHRDPSLVQLWDLY